MIVARFPALCRESSAPNPAADAATRSSASDRGASAASARTEAAAAAAVDAEPPPLRDTPH